MLSTFDRWKMEKAMEADRSPSPNWSGFMQNVHNVGMQTPSEPRHLASGHNSASDALAMMAKSNWKFEACVPPWPRLTLMWRKA